MYSMRRVYQFVHQTVHYSQQNNIDYFRVWTDQ